MSTPRLILTLLHLCFATPAFAADLAAIPRTIAREPAYENKNPKYCLVVFGPEAKTRVWVVQDGESLYVDRNCNGDLTEADDRIEVENKGDRFLTFKSCTISDGTLTHKDFQVSLMRWEESDIDNPAEFARMRGQGTEAWSSWINLSAERPADDKRDLPQRIGYVINGDGLGYLLFGDKPENAPVIHINGPWSLGLQDMKQKLTVGRKSRLQIGVGTPGVGPGTFAFIQYSKTIPTDAYPNAEIQFLAKSKSGEGISQTFKLMSRC